MRAIEGAALAALLAAACSSESSGGPSTITGAAGAGGVAAGPGGGGSSPGGAVAGGARATASTGGAASAAAGATNGAGGAPGFAGAPASGGSVARDGGAQEKDGAADDGGARTPFKGVANSPCTARTALRVSWYYNWMQQENEPCSDGRGGTFVPMVWGHTGNEQSATGIANAVAAFANRGEGYVLGFNEPDNASQANISVANALSLWPSFAVPGIAIGSPASQANTTGKAWFQDFVDGLQSRGLRADFLAIHWYGWNAGSCDASASQLEGHIRWAEGLPGNRPIWITEFGCLNQSAPDANTVVRFFQGALAVFDRHPRIARYAWYPWATNNGLVNGDGSLTALGTAYAAAPMSR